MNPFSKIRYDEEYTKFIEWLKVENVIISCVNDEILLVYLSNLSKVNKPSTLWSKFSMLRSCLKVKHNIDATSFPKCCALLKRLSASHVPKKSSVLSADEVSKFMSEAPDYEWLLTKVVLALGVFGACRRDDLLNLNVEDVKDCGSFMTVFVKEGKTNVRRSFTITDEDCPFKPCELIRKYMSLRPSNMTSKRFIIGYRQGKCVSQNVGKNTIACVPKNVAKFLGLENPERYTGHALRRSSASMLVEGGGDLLTLKRHGGWKSTSVAEGYIEESISRKVEVSKKLFRNVSTPSCSNSSQVTNQQERYEQMNFEINPTNVFTVDDIFDEKVGTEPMRQINFSNISNCTFNIYNK
jgi:integrase